MYSYRSLARCLWLVALVFASSQCLANELRFSSSKYQYSFVVPAGWVAIPGTEIADFKSTLPPQAQHLIYDAAFQRGSTGDWFKWPYFLVQVIPAERTKLKRLPTETEFQQFVSAVTGGKTLERVNEAVAATSEPDVRRVAESLAASAAKATIQVDLQNRRYWYVTEGRDPVAGAIKAYIAGTFLPNGNVIQIAGYSGAKRFGEDIKAFVQVSHSLRAFSKVSQESAPSLVQEQALAASPFDSQLMLRDAAVGGGLALALVGGVWLKSKRRDKA